MSCHILARTGLICSLLLTCFACTTGYNPSRVYIPKHSAAQQLEVEVSTSQAHIAYSMTDKFALHLGGVYLSVEEDGMYTGTPEVMEQYGGELGVHYTHPLASMLNVSLGLSSTLEQWSASKEKQWRNSNSERFVLQEVSAESWVVRPAAQLAVTLFVNRRSRMQSRSAFTLFTRLHHPLFGSQEMSAVIADPLWLDVGAHLDLKLTQRFGFYAQALGINPLKSQRLTTLEESSRPDGRSDAQSLKKSLYDVEEGQIYFGLSYRWGAEVYND